MTDEKLRQEQADEEMINQGFEKLLDSYLASKHRKKIEIITKAFNFAKQAHKGVKPRSAPVNGTSAASGAGEWA